MPQFEKLDCKRGAPMGRAEWRPEPPKPIRPTEKKSIRLFNVNLDSGGYDDGGAYWGLPRYNLWCATNDDDYRQFVRADTREKAADDLMLGDILLKRSTGRDHK